MTNPRCCKWEGAMWFDRDCNFSNMNAARNRHPTCESNHSAGLLHTMTDEPQHWPRCVSKAVDSSDLRWLLQSAMISRRNSQKAKSQVNQQPTQHRNLHTSRPNPFFTHQPTRSSNRPKETHEVTPKHIFKTTLFIRSCRSAICSICGIVF
jgi:hypothetical protein